MADLDDLDAFSAQPPGELANRAARLLTQYLRAPDGKKDPQLMREVARVILDAREQHFIIANGDPDIGGRSFVYRRWMSDVWNQTTRDPAEKAALSNLMRYHVGNEMRLRFSEEKLLGIGLQASSLRERGTQRRSKRSALVELFRAGPPLDSQESVEAMERVVIALRRLRPEEIASADRASLLVDLDEAIRRLEQLRADLV